MSKHEHKKTLPSLSISLTKTLLAGLVLVFAFITIIATISGQHLLKNLTDSRVEYIHSSQADNIAQLLWDIEFEKIDVLLENITRDENIAAARVQEIIDSKEQVFTHKNWPDYDAGGLLKTRDIFYVYPDGRTRQIGTLDIIVDYSSINSRIMQFVSFAVFVLISASVFLGALLFGLIKAGIDPVTRLSDSLVGVDYFSHKIHKEESGTREINDLFDSLIKMQSIMQGQTQEIQAQRTMLDTIIEKMPLGVMVENVVDDGCNIIVVNNMFRSMFGVSSFACEGSRAADVLPLDRAGFLDGMNDKVLADKNNIRDVYEINAAEDQLIIEVVKAPILNKDGQIVMIVTMFDDISDKVAMMRNLELSKEKAEVANKAKSDFLANMSHEIRTPMNAILGMTNFLMDTKLTREQKECADAIQVSGDTLLKIINDIIDISKIEAEKLVLEKIDFDLFAAIEEIVRLYSYQARSKGIEFLVDIDPDMPRFYKGDPTRLKQIFTNLISNAIKFTSEGHVLFKAEGKKHGLYYDISFSISDTGIGISNEHQKKIFEKFSQAEESTTRKYGGTGLGLAIVTQLIKMMDGEISVESEAGKGSSFAFNVVLAESKQEDNVVLTDSIKSSNILIVDDYGMTRKVIQMILSKYGIDSVAVESAEEALVVLKDKENKFDACLIDFALGGMDGLELSKKIRKQKKFDKMPLIIVSGAMSSKSYDDMQKIGLDGCLNKPFRSDQLINLLNMAVRNKKKNIKDVPILTHYNVAELMQNKASNGHVKPEDIYTKYSGKRVLAVDDMSLNMLVIRKVLKKFNLEVDEAVNGIEALNMVMENGYDAVFMDCQMPEMDGFEATTEIRRFETANHHDNVPIIALTADAMIGDREKCMLFGMNDYINKPFKESDIAQVLEKWVGG